MAAAVAPSTPSVPSATSNEEPSNHEKDYRWWMSRGNDRFIEALPKDRKESPWPTPDTPISHDEVLKLPGKHKFPWSPPGSPRRTESPPTPASISPPKRNAVPVAKPIVIDEILLERDRQTEGAAKEMRRHSEDSLHRDDLAGVDLTRIDNQLAVEAILRARLVKQPIEPKYAGWPHLTKLEERTRKISSETGAEPNSGQGLLGKKYWCSHWVRRKECDFIQQGCMYFHWIPAQDLLTGLGFQDYPQWYKDMTAEEQKVYTPSWKHGGIPPDFEKAAPKRHSRKRDHSDFSSDSTPRRENGRTGKRPVHRNSGNHRDQNRFSPPKRNGRDPHMSPPRRPPGPPRGGPNNHQSRPMGPPPPPNAQKQPMWQDGHGPSPPVIFINPLAKTYRPEDYPPRFPGNTTPSIAATSAPPTPVMPPAPLSNVLIPDFEPLEQNGTEPDSPSPRDGSSPKRRRGDNYVPQRRDSMISITSSIMAQEAANASVKYPPLVPERLHAHPQPYLPPSPASTAFHSLAPEHMSVRPPPTPSSVLSEPQRFFTPFENRSQNHGTMSRPRSCSPSADLSSSVPDLGGHGPNMFGVIGDQRPKPAAAAAAATTAPATATADTLEDGEIPSKPAERPSSRFDADEEDYQMDFSYF